MNSWENSHQKLIHLPISFVKNNAVSHIFESSLQKINVPHTEVNPFLFFENLPTTHQNTDDIQKMADYQTNTFVLNSSNKTTEHGLNTPDQNNTYT